MECRAARPLLWLLAVAVVVVVVVEVEIELLMSDADDDDDVKPGVIEVGVAYTAMLLRKARFG